MLRVRVVVATVLLAACGGSPPHTDTPALQSLDQKSAEGDAKGIVGEVYKTLNRANTDGLMTLVAEPLVVFGPRQVDAMATRTEAIVALRGYLETAKKLAVRSASLVVVASPGGRSAFAIDAIVAQNQRMAMTAILSNADDLWLVTALDLAATPAAGVVRAAQKLDAVVPTAMAGTPKTADGAGGAVERFAAGLANPTLVADDLARDGATTFAIGPSGDITRGKAIAKAWAKRHKAHVRAASAGEMSSGITADHQLAWVSAPVVQFADREEPLPLRVFAVYAHTDAGWRLAAYHETLAIGDAGIGAAYRKIGAPPLPVEPVPAKPTKPTKPTKKR
ncbi:MAG: hypothetical protein NT062_01070 [Proteobacteria bacterium]|nr:hypothetical protein [Pseudomonadota bacterium]